jgi:inhibitor of KinA sporulation pathway (predicted exonuclease)
LNRQIILFDIEYTAWEGSQARRWSGPGEHREIIQIAAVRLAIGERAAEVGCFDRLVRPQRNPLLSPYITDLTGIQQSVLDLHGVSFPQALAEFFAFCNQGQTPLFCWGDDPAVLDENFALHALNQADYPMQINDIRVLFAQAGIDTRPYTSGTVYQAVGAGFDQAAHNALNDVRSMAVTIQHLMHTGQIGSESWMCFSL